MPRPLVGVDNLNAILLFQSLLNASYLAPSLRTASLGLLGAVTTHLGFQDPLLMPITGRSFRSMSTRYRLTGSVGGHIPTHPSIFSGQISEKLSLHAPELTGAVISEFTRCYRENSVQLTGVISRKYSLRQAPLSEFKEAAPRQDPVVHPSDEARARNLRWQRSTAVMLVAPWIRNLSCFYDPANPLFDPSGETIRKVMKDLLEATSNDKEVSRSSVVFPIEL